jgi:hypothetical protein
MSTPVLGFDQHGNPIRRIKEGMITTAAVISCVECKTIIRGMGGPKNFSKCVACADIRVLLRKTYTSEETSDLTRDLHEAFDPRFTPEAEGIPKDEHGFDEGTFELVLTWRAPK